MGEPSKGVTEGMSGERARPLVIEGEPGLVAEWEALLQSWGFDCRFQAPAEGPPAVHLCWRRLPGAPLPAGTPLVAVGLGPPPPPDCVAWLDAPPDQGALRAALERAWALVDMEKRLRELNREAELVRARAIEQTTLDRGAGRRNRHALLRDLFERVVPIVDPGGVILHDYDAKEGRLRPLAQTPDIEEGALLLGEPAWLRRTRHAAMSNRGALVVHVEHGIAGDPSMDARAAQVYVGIPIAATGRTTGLLELFDPPEPLRATVAEIEALAGDVALATTCGLLAEELRWLTIFDDLTQVYNMDFFEDVMDREIQRAQAFDLPLALIFADLDGFKAVNDTFGHEVGSRLLREVGGYLLKRVRAMDVVGRFGGDEFVILLPETSLDGARALAERLREGLVSRNLLAHMRLDVDLDMSCGIATFPHPCTSKEALLKAADAAMYRAKAAFGTAIDVARPEDVVE